MNFLKKLFLKKIIFKKVNQIDILMLDDKFANINFNNLNFHYFNPNKYYFFELLKSIFVFVKNLFQKKFSVIYFEIFVNSLKPKIAVGHEMNNRIFLFKKIFPHKKAACYQFAFIFKEDIDFFYRKKFKNLKVDYFFAYDKRSIFIMQKYIKANYFINGSTKANEKIKHSSYSNNQITYISRFKPLSHIKNKKILKMQKSFMKYDSLLLKIIYEYCLKKKIKLVIAFTSTRKDKKKYNFFEEELNFYKDLVRNFQISKDNFQSCLKSKLIISSTSNLGYELLFAKKKVLFLDEIRKEQYSFFKTNSGPFWYCGQNTKKIRNYIDDNFKDNQVAWLKKLYKIDNSFKIFHKKINLYKNNVLFKKKIYGFLEKHD